MTYLWRWDHAIGEFGRGEWERKGAGSALQHRLRKSGLAKLFNLGEHVNVW